MELSDFTEGMRVELSPATDAWMSGDRFGTVLPNKGVKYVWVSMDRSGKVRKIIPDLLTVLTERSTGEPMMLETRLASTTIRPPKPARPAGNARQRRAMRNGAQRYSVMHP